MSRSAGSIGALCAVLAWGCDDSELWRRWGELSDDGSARAAPSDAGVTLRCDEDNGGIRLAPGFCALVFADKLGKARHLAVTPRGDVYVAVADTPSGPPGGVVALRDEDGDGRADRIERFGAEGGNGIAYANGALYFAPDDKVVRYALDQFVPSAAPVTIVSGLPASPDHYAKSIVVRGDALFVNIGSSSNACQVENRIPHSPGLDPCPELSTRAGVWKFARDEQGQRQRDGERFVSGTRNANALALNPRDGELYAMLNGRDQLYDNWPELYSQRDDALAPAEELLRLKKSANYGWPYCYYEPRLAKKVLAPEYGGDGLIEGRCSVYELPIASLPAHWAPLGMSFYDGTSFPARYRDGAFIASHGSRFAPNASGSLPGYNVVFQPFRRGQPSGQYTEFATGFAGDGRPLPEAARYRPAGVAQGPDGSLYISDDKVGRIWRVIAIRA